MILLARTLSVSAFGFFVIAFTPPADRGTLQAALITRPHNVLGATRRGRHYADYSTTAAVAQLGFTGSARPRSRHCDSDCLRERVLRGIFAPRASYRALAAWQLQELGRRMLYTEGRLAAAFGNDIVSYGGQAVALLVLWQVGHLTGTTALFNVAAAFAVGAAVVAVQLRPTLSGRPRVDSLAANWHFGSGSAVAEVGQWFSTQFW